MNRRYHGFDLLRGICAIAIMVHHLIYWRFHSGLHNIGTYTVYVFFMLSGASMVIAYANKMAAGMKYSTFILRRYFRLAPLYWLIVLSRGAFGAKFGYALLNISFLFGFANPQQTGWAGGGWSLGIEFVFYFTFPLFLALSGTKHNQLLILPIVLIQWLFVRSLNPMTVGFWIEYTQFVSFIAYFYIGCVIGRLLIAKPLMGAQALLWGAFFGLLIITGTICIETDYSILGSIAGVGLTAVCGILVLCAGYLSFPARLIWLPATLGSVSYGVYLLHFRIYDFMSSHAVFETYGEIPFMASVTISTIILATLIEKYFERPIRKWGYSKLSH